MMKCLTLWEPWASLLAASQKRIETRHWITDYRGPVAIHAAKGGLGIGELLRTIQSEPFRSCLLCDRRFSEWAEKWKTTSPNPRTAFSCGNIIAVGILSDCLPTEADICIPGVFDDYPELDTPQERAFGNYAPGRFGFVLMDVALLETPVPFKSRQGKLIDLDRTAELAVRDQWWQRCCSCPAEAHMLCTHEVERGEHYCRGCNSRHDYREASHKRSVKN